MLAKNADVLVTMDGRAARAAGCGALCPRRRDRAGRPLQRAPRDRRYRARPVRAHRAAGVDQLPSPSRPGADAESCRPVRTPISFPGCAPTTGSGPAARRRTRGRRSSSVARSWRYRDARRSSTTPMSSRTDARSTTRSTPRPRSAFASPSRAAVCRSVSRKADCHRTTASRTKTRSCATRCG